jgi:hypothetical protein
MNMSAPTGTVANNLSFGNLQEDLARAMGAAQSGDKATAHSIFQALATRHPNATEVWVWLGGTSQNLDEAEAAFQRAVLLDPSSEEANLGLRWVALRRQAMYTVGAGAAFPSNTGSFSTDRIERHTSFDLTTGAFDSAIPAATGPLGTGFLSNSANNTVSTGNGTLTGPLKTSDADASLKIKVDGQATGKRRHIPVAAIALIVVALFLYAFALIMYLNLWN